MKIIPQYLLLIGALQVMLPACNKQFLDKKPSTNIVVPSTLSDMTQLLDNNEFIGPSGAVLPFISGEEYHFPSYEQYLALPSKTERNGYIWKKDVYEGETNIPDWNMLYKAVFISNIVLNEWEKLNVEDKGSIQGKFVKAWALLCRSYAYLNLVQVFAPAYNPATASTDPGVPLRLSADINDLQPRASVQQVFDLITTDLESSIALYATDFDPNHPARGSKAAAHALLARTYLYMGSFEKALEAAEQSSTNHTGLLDYNVVDASADKPFALLQPELILARLTNPNYFETTGAVYASNAAIDQDLLHLYEPDDLRKDIFFREVNGEWFMKVGYSPVSYYPFTGLAVDEMYLIRAECLARKGELTPSLLLLNELLAHRYKTGTYVDYISSDPDVVLAKILTERRKELVWRGIRWSDLKRLNAAGANIEITRQLNGETYTLSPNDPRYALPIPDDEIAISNIEQNQR
jgi:hypothetical protein